jgi:hypothetical protein
MTTVEIFFLMPLLCISYPTLAKRQPRIGSRPKGLRRAFFTPVPMRAARCDWAQYF